ncbi:MAG: bacterial proteasome activator family protein [Actinomycetota bacterium]|nr:bacterial proteasome activator family protein [Actinomycetota bacterium]
MSGDQSAAVEVSGDRSGGVEVSGGARTRDAGVGRAPENGVGAVQPAQPGDLVDEPAKVMRIGTMIRQLLEEVKSAPLDEAARSRLAQIHERSINELEDGLAPELVDELHRITLPFSEDTTPSDAELRIAQAQLVGWLEGLFHGIQAALAAQQMANQHTAAQLQLRQLPPGTVLAPGVIVGENGEPQRAPAGTRQANGPARDEPGHGPGQYL